jgi:Ni/Co efflux regulator RcnB
MKKLALTLALGAAAVFGASAANAAPAQEQTQAPIASHADNAKQATDMSSRHRHWRHHRVHRWHRHHHRHWGYNPGYYRSSYGYYGAPAYYRPAPVVSFGFGFGGPRWGHHHRHW